MRLLALAALAWTAVADAAHPVAVDVANIRVDGDTGLPVVELVERGGMHRTLPILVGLYEAQAIAMELGGVQLPRPMPHDLMKRLVEGLGAELDRVEIAGREQDTYLAYLQLRGSGGERVRIDARPSDAIALAVRLRRPIVVEAGVFPRAELLAGGALARVWGVTVQPLTADLAPLIGAQDAHGALVSDVDPAGPARRLRRGDVIVGVDSTPVASPFELASYAQQREPGARPRLAIRRGERMLHMRLQGAPRERETDR